MLTPQEHQANLVTNAFHREMEIYGYQVNIDNYVAMLAALPTDDWPVDLANYRGVPVEAFPASLTDEQVQTISDYQYRDRLVQLLRSERIEQGKSIRVRDALKMQIGEDYDALLAAHKASQTI